MFKKILHISALVIFWGAIGYYIVWSLQQSDKAMEKITVNRLEITVTDSNSIDIITRDMIRQWIDDAGINPVGKRVETVSTSSLNNLITSNPFVASVKSHVDFNGKTSIIVKQREPILRVNTTNGDSFYYTNDGYIIPSTQYSSHYVPIVTGTFYLPFTSSFTGNLESFISENKKNSDKNYLFLCKLINFVRYVNSDDFWDSEIVQINVVGHANGLEQSNKEPEIELIPRIGDNTVMLGTLDDFKSKLNRLQVFYRYAQSWDGWQSGGYLNLKYDNQIVCTNNKNEI